MLRVELTTQLMRLRTLIALLCLAAVPVAAGLSFASSAGHRNGSQGGLFGASPYSALNHAMASLEFIGPLLLPIVVALLSAAIASADRDWGVLRYLYVAPVNRTRLLAAKLGAVAIATTAALICVLGAGLAAGWALFGWHPFHLIDAPNLTTTETITRVLAAGGYTLLCMLAMAAITLALGLLLLRGAEALAVAIAFVVIASILNGQTALHAVAVLLPVHYWQNWLQLFDPAADADLWPGAATQLIWIALSVSASGLILHRRDPAA
ncbi:ABC transporter permease subunit [Paractinoplanes globisporus]|uniref:ABC transporter permease subunit n=1 Tax=Paractinoplanes globisporus TaxID=113565 RepID=A0ABW6WCK8_9ACTN|nr:ABC transporter permease subunit [Actinoplanes globisporus]